MTKLFDCGECATGCYGRCMRARVKEMDDRNKAIVAWGQPDAAGNIVETISPDEKVGEMKAWAAQYTSPLVKQEEPANGCLRCNTPKKCAVHGCSPLTWPSEAPSEPVVFRHEDIYGNEVGPPTLLYARPAQPGQEPVTLNPMLLRDVADITGTSVQEVREALQHLGLNFNRSTNMAMTPEDVVAVCKHLLNAKGNAK